MKGIGVALAVTVGCSLPRPARELSLSLPAESSRLPNGATAVLVPDAAATSATILVRYQVGAIDDPEGQEGVAHLASHLLFDQRPGTSSLRTQLERIAIDVGVEPHDESTEFIARFTPDHLEEILKLEAVRLSLRCATIDDATFTAERDAMADELAAHDSWRLNRIVNEQLFQPNDPMRRAYAATPASVAALTRDQACAFIDRHYAPGNALVMVTGPIDRATFARAVEQLGRVPARTFDAHAAAPSSPRPVGRSDASADVTELTLAVAWPSPRDPGDRVRSALVTKYVTDRLGGAAFDDGRTVLFWLPSPRGVDERLAGLRDVLERSVGGLSDPRPVSFGGRTHVVNSSAVRVSMTYAAARIRGLTSTFTDLDGAFSRLRTLAARIDIGAEIAALDHLNADALRDTVHRVFAESQARIVVLSPDGSRSPDRRAGLDEPIHKLPPPRELDAVVDAPPPIAKRPAPRTFRLDNGLAVVLQPTSSVPLAEVRLVFRAGWSASPIHGLASIALATLNRSIGYHMASVEGLRHLFWVTTNVEADASELVVRAPSIYIDRMIDRFYGYREAFAGLETTAAEVLEARAQRDDHARNRDDLVLGRIYGTHPYGPSSTAPGATPTVRDIQDHIRRYLRLDNATLIVAGQFDPDLVEKWVRHVFGFGRATPSPAPVPPPVRAGGAAFADVDERPRVDVRLAWLVGPVDDDHAARAVIGSMIDALLPSGGVWLWTRASGGHVWIHSSFDPAVAPERIATLRDRIAALADGSEASQRAFAAARRMAVLGHANHPSSVSQWAGALSFAARVGRDPAWREAQGERARQLQYADVQRVLVREFGAGNAVWLVTGPREAVDAVYRALGMTPTWVDRAGP